MKRLFLLSSLVISVNAFAQPVILNGNNAPVAGFNAVVSSAAATVAPGAGGANVTWDFSSLVAAPIGTAEIIAPSSSPFASSFPQANFCTKITPTGAPASIYSFEKITTGKWETIANNYAGPGTGKDYSPNPESSMKFPFSYLEAFVDTYQTTTNGPFTTDITYDGYGTLITPFATYTNVIRVKKYWGPGDYNYNWMSTNPLFILMNYDATNNSYILVGNGSVGMNEVNKDNIEISPTLAIDRVFIRSSATLSSVVCTNGLGQRFDTMLDNNSVDVSSLPAGLYFVTVATVNGNTTTKKFIKQ